MEWKEYLKEQMKKVENQEEKGAKLGIYINDDTKFIFHEDCFVDLQEDFCILYDKKANVNMAIKYDNITMVNYLSDEILKNVLEDISFEALFKKLMED